MLYRHPESHCVLRFELFTRSENLGFLRLTWRYFNTLNVLLKVVDFNSGDVQFVKQISIREFYFMLIYLNDYTEPMKAYLRSQERTEVENDTLKERREIPDLSGVECCICLKTLDQVALSCGHSFCEPCIKKWSMISQSCPNCRAQFIHSDSSYSQSWVITNTSQAGEDDEYMRKILEFLFEYPLQKEDFLHDFS